MHAPATPATAVGPAGECKVYRVRHAGETAAAVPTWESLHFNEAAVQFHLMLGVGSTRGASVREVLVCVNETTQRRFEARRAELEAAGKPTGEIWVFHGTGTQVRTRAARSAVVRVPVIYKGGCRGGAAGRRPVALRRQRQTH